MLRRALARLVMRLIGPELEAEIDRRAETIAQHRAGIALSLARRELASAVQRLCDQDINTLDLVTNAFEQRDQSINTLFELLRQRPAAVPGEHKPERDDATLEVIPPSKLN